MTNVFDIRTGQPYQRPIATLGDCMPSFTGFDLGREDMSKYNAGSMMLQNFIPKGRAGQPREGYHHD